MNNQPVTIGITMGDPSGIGPEIILKSYEHRRISNKRIVVIGDFNVMSKAFNLVRPASFKLHRISEIRECDFTPSCLNILDIQIINMTEFLPGRLQAASGSAAYECIRIAVDLAENRNHRCHSNCPS